MRQSLKISLPRDRGADAHLLLLLAEGETGIALFHDEGAGAAGAFGFVGHGDDAVDVRFAAVGDPLLGAVQDIFVAVVDRGGGMPPASLPALDSVKAEGRQASPRAMSGRYFFFCSSVPKSRRG